MARRLTTALAALWVVAMGAALMPGWPAMAASPETVFAVAHYDWNEDGWDDRAMLLDNPTGDKDLVIFLSDGRPDAFVRKTTATAIVWSGAMEGTKPWLEITERGALRIHSGNQSIGRGRWTETLTVLFRDHHFVVGGYTYRSRDTLDLDTSTTCDVNLFTGKGTLNDAPIRTRRGAIPVNAWTLPTNLCQSK